MTAMPEWESAAERHGSTSGPLLPFDASKPNIARAYDYMLGGKDHFPPDRDWPKRSWRSIRLPGRWPQRTAGSWPAP